MKRTIKANQTLFSSICVCALLSAGIGSGCGRATQNRGEVRAQPAASASYGQLAELESSGEYAQAPAVASELAPPRGEGAPLRGLEPGVAASQRGAPAPMKMSADSMEPQAFERSRPPSEFDTEAYDHITENRFISVAHAPLSTFSVDVDTASYSNVRRFLTEGTRPPAGAVRIEELVNYFDYAYENPADGRPFSVHTEVGPAPWAPEHKLMHIGLQGKRISQDRLPPRNLVFLIDVSGSMQDQNKLPLLKRSFAALLDTMSEKDTVSIVVYAGASGMVLPPTSAHQKQRIRAALDQLEAGGSTNGAAGIELAYQAAQQRFRPGGVNRVIIATDGDFNIGVTSQSELVDLIEKKRELGIFLTVLGYGMGNYKDSTLESLADKGNGNYAYIDSYDEARKVLVEEGGANLVTIAKDVKIQVEMNPRWVGAYRLIGYENRRLETEDFNDDGKDAGEIGAGHSVTALYEILSPEQAGRALRIGSLRYQKPTAVTNDSEELATVKLRFKPPMGSQSRLVEYPVRNAARPLATTSEAFRFSAAVAGFGMLLRGSQYAGAASYQMVSGLASGALGRDAGGYRREFIGLVARAQALN